MVTLPNPLLEELRREVQMAFAATGIVDVSGVAEQIRLRNEHYNVALEDFQRHVLQVASLLGAPMLLESTEAIVAGGGNDRVELVNHGPGWIVRLTEKGAVDERHFEIESHARSYASGQRYRLGATLPVLPAEPPAE